jgi:hypothetical protein
MIQNPRFRRDLRTSLADARSENGGRERSGARGLERYPLPVIIWVVMVLSTLWPLALLSRKAAARGLAPLVFGRRRGRAPVEERGVTEGDA